MVHFKDSHVSTTMAPFHLGAVGNVISSTWAFVSGQSDSGMSGDIILLLEVGPQAFRDSLCL